MAEENAWSSDEEWSRILSTLNVNEEESKVQRAASKGKKSVLTVKKEESKVQNATSIARKIKQKYHNIRKNYHASKENNGKKILGAKTNKRKIITKNESDDSDFSSSDNIPLKFLKPNQNTKSSENEKGDAETDYEESLVDSEDSYKPTKKDMNSSDSEFSSDEMEIKQEKPKYATLLKKTKKVPLKKKHTKKENLERDEQNDIVAAKYLSMNEAMTTSAVREQHEKRLDSLLKSNGLQRQPVPPDGNCFFQSAVHQIQSTYTANQLRQILCDYMLEHGTQYRSFFSTNFENNTAEEDLFWIDYITEIEKLKENGSWTSNSADLLPKVLADWSGRYVRIFSSSTMYPVIDVPPTCNTSAHSPIYLAYISSDRIPEHYDSCIKVSNSDPNSNKVDHLNSYKRSLAFDTLNQECEQTEETVIEISTTTTEEEGIQLSENIEGCTVENENSQNPVNQQLATPIKHNVKKGRPKGSVKPKLASIMTPPKKKLVRKKKATPENWKKNVRKNLRISGKEYATQRGQIVTEKRMKPVDCKKCKFKCSDKITEQQRTSIFETFWSLGSYERQKDFIISKISQRQTRTYLDENNQPVKKSRQVYRSYTFTIENVNVSVCKNFFLNTLSIGESYVNHAMKNEIGGVFTGGEKRGKHKPHNKTSEKAMQFVRRHIESFPAVESHYTRKDSRRKYLGADLNITKMYELYLEFYKNNVREDELVSQAIYRRTFNEEYNLSFHLPKKDQCNICVNYHREEQGNLTDEMKTKFNKHQEDKQRARDEKAKDKKIAKTSDNTFVATFDLQAVLSTPCSLVQQLYYNRKLSCYNLSVFNLGNKNATCYLWSEVEARRGACEIATCLYLQLLSLPSNIKHAIFYSDNCPGQNRNQFIATSFMHAVTFLPNIETIDHKFLEQGHTQMECDSMHSAIEFAKKHAEIYVPQEWANIIRTARKTNPYLVVPLKHGDIWDFKAVQTQCMKYSKVEASGLKINWLKMKWLRFVKEDPDTIQFKYNYDEEFRKMRISATGKRGRPAERTKDLPKRYTKKQSISAAKKKDLLSLCSTDVIPSFYHDFFKSLPSTSNVRDKLPDPDMEESDIDSDNE